MLGRQGINRLILHSAHRSIGCIMTQVMRQGIGLLVGAIHPTGEDEDVGVEAHNRFLRHRHRLVKVQLGQRILYLGESANIIKRMLGTIISTLITHKNYTLLLCAGNISQFLLQLIKTCIHFSEDVLRGLLLAHYLPQLLDAGAHIGHIIGRFIHIYRLLQLAQALDGIGVSKIG